MTHNHLYTFAVDKGRVLQFKNNIQIARLHSFSYTNSEIKYTKGITLLYENLLACSNHDGTIVIIDIFSRIKKVIKVAKTQLSTLAFLNKEKLVSTSVDGLVKVHNLQTLKTLNVIDLSLATLLKNKIELKLEEISLSILRPLMANNSFELAFDLMDDNPWLKETTEYLNIENLYRAAFSKAIEALREAKIPKAQKLLERFKNVKSKKREIEALFGDFKHYDRFKLHLQEKKYAIAFAVSSKHTSLTLTAEFTELERLYIESFNLAKNQMKIGQKELAKETLSQYMTILTKRDEIKNLLNGIHTTVALNTEEAELNSAYERNDFKECYELIDSYSLKNLELIQMLEKHWIKLILKCEDYALGGDIKAIKRTLGELITTKTRLPKIGELLRVAFYSKIRTLLESKKFHSGENIIYSYIDIFGVDIEISDIMKKFEKRSSKKLAITQNQRERVARDAWLNAELIVES